MAEFKFVASVAEFKNLDEGDILEGYLDGVSGGPAPGSGHSRSYWHGWRNGAIESNRQDVDAAYLQLADAFQSGAVGHESTWH